MTSITSHKLYVFSIVFLGIFSLFLLFDFDAQQKIEHYNPSGITHYNLSYDIFPPSPYLFKRVFLNSIERFQSRDTLVFVGNSIIAGIGAKDTLHFDNLLNVNFNVINAALKGEHIGASSALALLAIEANFRRHPQAFQHIFVAYAPSRMYAGTYWLTGSALSKLAEERNLSDYIVPYTDKTTMGVFKQTIEGIITINLRCIINRNNIVSSIKNRSFQCVKPFDIEFKDPGFLKAYNRQIDVDTNQERKDLSKFVLDTIFIDNQSKRNSMLNDLVEHITPLERFLVKNKVLHQIHFMLLRDSPKAIETLPIQKRVEYELGKKVFLEVLAQKTPGWRILEAPLMENSDFFDAAHLRESGQTKVAAFVKQTVMGIK